MGAGKTKKLKKRMETVANAEKITNAMGLVATAKLGNARDKIQKSRPYFEILQDTLEQISSSTKEFTSPYIKENDSPNVACVVIGGDRGMAGGFNSNLFRLAEEEMNSHSTIWIPIGKKSVEYFSAQNALVQTTAYTVVADCTVATCFEISKEICHGFLQKDFHKVFLYYTHFTSMMEQTPSKIQLLPMISNGNSSEKQRNILYEPDEESVYNAIVPEYVAGSIYGAICESRASELCARHTAMETASKNAQEMEEKLQLAFNHERQSAITGEIIEIVAGAGEKYE